MIGRIAVALCGATVACGLGGCELAPNHDPMRITMAIDREISSLDPAATFVVTNQLAMHLAYETLVVGEVEGGKPTGRIFGQLAERWERSDDGLTWTFFLQRGHRFDDGSEVTADAVKFSFERTLKLKAPPSQFLFFLAGVEVVDPYQVRFRLKMPIAFFLQVLAVPTSSIVNPAVMQHQQAGDLAARWLTSRTAGSGVYRVSRFEKGQSVVLKPNPHADRKPRYFREVAFVIVKDDTTRAIQLAKGAIDIVDPLSGKVDRWMAGQQGTTIVEGLSPTIVFLHMNNDRPLLKDVRVRRAVSLAIDRETLGNALYRGRARLLHGVLPEGVPGFDAGLPLPRFDPIAARALLAEAGVPPHARLALTVVGDSTGGSPALATAIQSQLNAIGLDVVIERISTAARTKIMKGDYDLTMQTINLDFPDPSIVFNFVYNSAMIGGANFPRYRNRDVDALISKADQELDPDVRAGLYRDAQQIVVRDSPTTVLFQLDWQFAMRSEIAGVNYNFAQPTFYNFESMYRVEPRAVQAMR